MLKLIYYDSWRWCSAEKIVGIYRSYSSSAKSALYVHGSKSQITAFLVEPDIDFDYRFNNIDELQKNIDARGMKFDIKMLQKSYDHLKELKNNKILIEEEKEDINIKMKTFIKTNINQESSQDNFSRPGASNPFHDKSKIHRKSLLENNYPEEISNLKNRSRDLRNKFKLLCKTIEDLEEETILKALKLPNFIHHVTPLGSKNKLLRELGEKPSLNFPIKNHIDIGNISDTLAFVSENSPAYYLKGLAAHVELALNNYVLNKCSQRGFQPFSTANLYKAAVAEGCGIDFKDPNSAFILQQNSDSLDNSGNLLLLTGVSLVPFAAYHTKTLVNQDDLPLKYSAAGRFYNPAALVEGNFGGLCNVHQSNKIDIFGATAKSDQCETMFRDFENFILEIYQDLKLPCRLIQIASQNLHFTEMQKIAFEVWLPFSKQYVPIANVSMYGNFVSKRLMMRYVTNGKKHYLNIVHGSVFCFAPLLASIMENYQTSNGFFIAPSVLSI